MTLSLVEIIMMVVLAITIGITIHFFISSRRSFRQVTDEASGKTSRELETWKLKYFNETESRDKELEALKQKLQEIVEDNQINTIEAEEMRKENKKLLAQLEALEKMPPPVQAAPPPPAPVLTAGDKPAYIEQLRQAQASLLEHNEKINQLLGQIDIIKQTEEKQKEIEENNEELNRQVEALRMQLSQKDKEIGTIQQKAHLTREMTSMLDSAYNEFNSLQDKIHKLENQVTASKKVSLEYDDLKEQHYKVKTEFEEQRLKYNAAFSENQELHRLLEETQEKLRDTTFQKQQLQKRVAYLEELNNDMQAVSETNKKLEGQLRRIGELESMLNVISEERDELARKQFRDPE